VARSLRGHEATHIIVDEAAYVEPGLIEETLFPMMATTEGKMTLISTPNGHNAFWRFFEHGQSGEPAYWSRRGPSSENPRVSKSYLAAQKMLVSERAFAVEYEAEFMDGEGTVFTSEAIARCLVSEIGAHSGPYFVGIDWARYADFTVVTVLSGTREDAKVVEMQRLHRLDWNAQLEIASSIIRRYPSARVVCDSTGIGDRVVDELAALLGGGVKRVAFNATNKAKMIDSLVALMEKGALRFAPDPVLLKELKAFRWHAGKLEGGGEHDDTVISLALAALELPREYGPVIRVGRPRQL
jgi:phage FluMu gp28-like protein